MKNNGKFLTQQVISQLEERILQNSPAPGNFFATEDQLCQELGVSRSVIRDALGRLKGVGILESKRNVGLIIGKVDPMELLDLGFSFYNYNKLDGYHLSEIRFILEIGAVESAIRNASQEQILEMEKLADKFELLIKEQANREEIGKVDVRFHELILEATGNILLQEMHTVIATSFKRANSFTKTPMDYYRNNEIAVIEHKAIVKAFRSRDFELAKSILTTHLKSALVNKT